MTVLFLNYMYKGKTRSDCRTPARIDTFWRLCFNLSRWTVKTANKIISWHLQKFWFFSGWFPGKVYLSLDCELLVDTTGVFNLTHEETSKTGQVTQCGCRSGRPRGQTHARLGKASKSRGFLASVCFLLGGGAWLHPKGWHEFSNLVGWWMFVTETSKSMGFVFFLNQDDSDDVLFSLGGGMWIIHDNPKSQPSDQSETWKKIQLQPFTTRNQRLPLIFLGL